jgi:GH15 family glucan-1,4-alpha-glucosidase
MSVPIEDYALLSDTYSAALVSRGGSVDWLAFPRFDSAPFFCALLGDTEHGHWTLAPNGTGVTSTRRYRDGTLVLETEHHTPDGTVRVVDAMPIEASRYMVRLVQGVSGRVEMRSVLRFRFDYGSVLPWVRSTDDGNEIIGGPEALRLRTPVATRGEDFSTVSEFAVSEGDEIPFELAWHPSHEDPPAALDVRRAINETQRWWKEWSSRCVLGGEWQKDVRDSLVVLKGLTYAPTGGIVAAATTSLPEDIGGARNWDYRFCWIRDATFTLLALVEAGYLDEAVAWRDWLLRTIAGDPGNLQIVYSVTGERRLVEQELRWLPGYKHSVPVRIGNDAYTQFQLDVFGETMDTLHHAREHDIGVSHDSWSLETLMLEYLEGHWREPDNGIWEVRGGLQHFTHSKVMAWVAFDRAVATVERFKLDGDVARWRAARDAIHAEVCERGVDDRGVFKQSYESDSLDASTLMIPLVGFLPPDDPRVKATLEAIETELMDEGFVRRYLPDPTLDGQPGDEGAFLLCSFWLADNYALLGRERDARELFERLLALRNDVGLLAEEFDPRAGRFLGNFPQALSHVAIAITALTLAGDRRHARTDWW